MFDYAHPESLVSTQWVADHLNDPAVRFVEVVWGDSDEWGAAAYRSGHIPGAEAWDFAAELQDPGRSDIADQAGMEVLLGRSGITPTSRSWSIAG
jgi:thiosulfate/3-mercaptopyruvate sulfurtransferase